MAGAAFGIGARINNACTLGTLAHLTGGNVVYGATILGMVAGATLMTSVAIANDIAPPLASPLEIPTASAAIFVLALGAMLVTAFYRRLPRWLRNLRDPASMRMACQHTTITPLLHATL